jgi:hypothetical protein
MLCEARYYGQTSSARLYTGSRKRSGFNGKPTVDEQMNEKPSTERPDSDGEQWKQQDKLISRSGRGGRRAKLANAELGAS